MFDFRKTFLLKGYITARLGSYSLAAISRNFVNRTEFNSILTVLKLKMTSG
jgi:hypothetical protein